jgi:hypothetical protein
MRPIGDTPELLADIGYALALMFENEMPDCNKILGVDMAGIPIATATSIVSNERRHIKLPFAYTRPLGGGLKTRTAEETKEKLKEWGGHELIEGRIKDGDNIAIWDDMATNIESKRIAREILWYVVQDQGINNVKCDHTGFLLYRGEPLSKTDIIPHFLIPFTEKGLDWLKDVMDKKEHELITHYQNNISLYQKEEVRSNALKNL